MKTVTLAQFKTFNPCWLEYENGENRLNEIGNRKEKWTALDVLNLDEVDPEDRLWAVLREEFIAREILVEFSCRCAERALRNVGLSDARYFDLIKAKRRWMRGEITGERLFNLWYAAKDETYMLSSSLVLSYNKCRAAHAAEAVFSTDAVYSAKQVSFLSAISALRPEERKWQVEELKKLLQEDSYERY